MPKAKKTTDASEEEVDKTIAEAMANISDKEAQITKLQEDAKNKQAQNDMLLAELEMLKSRLRLTEDHLKTARGVGSDWPAEPTPTSNVSDLAIVPQTALAAAAMPSNLTPLTTDVSRAPDSAGLPLPGRRGLCTTLGTDPSVTFEVAPDTMGSTVTVNTATVSTMGSVRPGSTMGSVASGTMVSGTMGSTVAVNMATGSTMGSVALGSTTGIVSTVASQPAVYTVGSAATAVYGTMGSTVAVNMATGSTMGSVALGSTTGIVSAVASQPAVYTVGSAATAVYGTMGSTVAVNMATGSTMGSVALGSTTGIVSAVASQPAVYTVGSAAATVYGTMGYAGMVAPPAIIGPMGGVVAQPSPFDGSAGGVSRYNPSTFKLKEQFSLGANITTFFDRMENMFEMQPGVPDDVKILAVKNNLDTVTFGIVGALVELKERPRDYRHFRAVCQARFEPQMEEGERRRLFKEERQGSDSPEVFYERLVKLAARAFSTPKEQDTGVLDQLLWGLSDPGIKQHLYLSPPANAQAAMTVIRRWSAAKRFVAMTAKEENGAAAEVNAVNYSNSHHGGQRDSGGQGRWAGQEANRSRTEDGRPICFRCGGANHIASRCYAPASATRPWKERQAPHSSSSGKQYAPKHWQTGGPPTYRETTSPARELDKAWQDGRGRATYSSRSPSPAPRQREDSGHRHERSQSPASRQNMADDTSRYQGDDYGGRRTDHRSRRDASPHPKKEEQHRGRRRVNTLELTSSGKSGHLSYVRGYLNEVLTYIMIDSGATVSVISNDYFKWLNKRVCIMLRPTSGNIKGITNVQAKVLGLCTLKLVITNTNPKKARFACDHTFLVVDGISTDCLIGQDFIEEYGANILSTSRIMTIAVTNTEHALVQKDFNDSPVPVYVTKKCSIPARSQMFVKCHLNNEAADVNWDWRQVKQVAVTPAASMCIQFKLLLANCVTSVEQGSVIVHVLNTTNKRVTLYPDITCCYAEPCDDRNVVYSVDVDGYPVDKPMVERHVTFSDDVHSACKTKVNVDQIKSWIKTNKLDCNVETFNAADQKQICELLHDFQDISSQFNTKIQEIQQYIDKQQAAEKQRHKQYYDQKFSTQFRFKQGNTVYKNNLAPTTSQQSKKFAPVYVGPFKVTDVSQDGMSVTIQSLENPSKEETVHPRRLKLAYPITQLSSSGSSDEDASEEDSDSEENQTVGQPSLSVSPARQDSNSNSDADTDQLLIPSQQNSSASSDLQKKQNSSPEVINNRNGDKAVKSKQQAQARHAPGSATSLNSNGNKGARKPAGTFNVQPAGTHDQAAAELPGDQVTRDEASRRPARARQTPARYRVYHLDEVVNLSADEASQVPGHSIKTP
jgi:hypothetical protein